MSVAVAAQLRGVSRTTVEAWKTEGVIVSAQQRLRHEVTMDDDLGELTAYDSSGLLKVYG